MTKRTPISAEQNIWFDAQQVDDTDLSLEQQHNTVIQSGIINNHIGTGILPEVLIPYVLFDSSLYSGELDGVAVSSQAQPSDGNFGNQLEIELTESIAAGNKTVKVAIIGLDFSGALQYETFVFKTNEIQVGKKHFAKILTLLFNDISGPEGYSFNLGGRVVIREVSPLTLSRNPVMVSQETQPNLFFRDFYVVSPLTLNSLLTSALPYYNVDDLNILTSELENKTLLANDVTTQIGQKFLASTNNIQKITLLLGVQNESNPSDLAWTGDLVISIYPLQSDVSCITDIAPNLPIEFTPDNIPLAQLSFNYNTLLSNGTLLDTVPQPVDFIFSNTSVGAGNSIKSGSYYAVTVKRSGSADTCDLLIACGGDYTENSRITVFTGKTWTDLPDQDLWFKIYTDSAKISDGQAYDTGIGCSLDKTIEDPTTLAQVDYCLDNLQFSGTDTYRAVITSVEVDGTPIPDQKTGNPVNSRKNNELTVNLLNSLDISSLQKTTEPLIAGSIVDKNKKFLDALTATITSKLYSASVVDNEILIKIVEDPTDTVRFDTSVSGLIYNLLNGDLVSAKIYPDITNSLLYYRIADARLCSMMLGDVNGDGIIDEEDLSLLNTYLDFNLNSGSPAVTTETYSDPTHLEVVNGYVTYINKFVNNSSLTFKLINKATTEIVASGTDGILVANPSDLRLANFTSASVDFSSVTGISDYGLYISDLSNSGNNGLFNIISLDTTSDVITLQKIMLNSETIQQLFRADIDGDFHVTSNDGYLLQSYINRIPSVSSVTPYPGPSTNQYTKIGTRFNVLKFALEKFEDRKDDYTTYGSGRSSYLHAKQDIFLNDGYFATRDFYSNPSTLRFERQLSWEEYLVTTKSRAKFVPSVFTSQTGFAEKDCKLPTVICEGLNDPPSLDNGKIDFYAPDNLILGGNIMTIDGYYHKLDFEVGTVILEIPDGLYGTEKTINILSDFIATSTDGDGNQTGLTRLGFKAMRFADCSYVTTESLAKDQLRFSVAVQSFSPNTNGLSDDGYYGAIVDGKIGVSVDYSTGLLRLNFTNLYQDTVLPTLSTKIQINVFLKKAGFNNEVLYVDYNKLQNMLELTSAFSGSGITPSGSSTTSARETVEVVGTGMTLSDLITLTDADQIVYVDISSASAIIYLPVGSEVGRKITLCVSNGSGVCSIGTPSEAIMGGTYVQLDPYGSATLEVAKSGYWALTSVVGTYTAG